MKDQLLKVFELHGLNAAQKFLHEQQDIPAALKAWGALARQIYNKQKNVQLMVDVFLQAIEYGLAANATPDEAQNKAINTHVKGLYYDLGANTWPGWGDEGITITPAQMAIGYQAAQSNLDWAQKLDKPAIPMSRAYWLLAAHQLAAQEYAAALTNFDLAAQFARKDEASGEALLASGFVAIINILQGQSTAVNQLDEIKVALRPLEHGGFFITQLETALNIFST